jgi:hemerythrin-like domain-containing protein
MSRSWGLVLFEGDETAGKPDANAKSRPTADAAGLTRPKGRNSPVSRRAFATDRASLDLAQYRGPGQGKNDQMKTALKPAAATDPVSAWHAEHVYFKSLLRLLQRELDVFHSGERPGYALMQDVITYLRDYSDRFHHPREDEAFRRLEKHCPEMALVLSRLHQEHRVIANSGELLLIQLNAIVQDTVVPRAEVEMVLATYLVYYGNHIAKEEEDVLPLAAKMLTAEDWIAVRDAVAPGRDPVFGDKPEERYQELRRQIALEAR